MPGLSQALAGFPGYDPADRIAALPTHARAHPGAAEGAQLVRPRAAGSGHRPNLVGLDPFASADRCVIRQPRKGGARCILPVEKSTERLQSPQSATIRAIVEHVIVRSHIKRSRNSARHDAPLARRRIRAKDTGPIPQNPQAILR